MHSEKLNQSSRGHSGKVGMEDWLRIWVLGQGRGKTEQQRGEIFWKTTKETKWVWSSVREFRPSPN